MSDQFSKCSRPPAIVTLCKVFSPTPYISLVSFPIPPIRVSASSTFYASSSCAEASTPGTRAYAPAGQVGACAAVAGRDGPFNAAELTEYGENSLRNAASPQISSALVFPRGSPAPIACLHLFLNASSLLSAQKPSVTRYMIVGLPADDLHITFFAPEPRQ